MVATQISLPLLLLLCSTRFIRRITTPTTASSFHDCFPNGCGVFVLVSSTAFNVAERNSPIKLSLFGDGFDVIVRAKNALQLTCPNTVSCSDIITVATRDLLFTVGGPYYLVFLGRRDSRILKSSLLADLLPLPSSPTSKLIHQFDQRILHSENGRFHSQWHTLHRNEG